MLEGFPYRVYVQSGTDTVFMTNFYVDAKTEADTDDAALKTASDLIMCALAERNCRRLVRDA